MCAIKLDCSPYLLRRLRSLEEALRDREIARALLAVGTATDAGHRPANGADGAAVEDQPPGGSPAAPRRRSGPA